MSRGPSDSITANGPRLDGIQVMRGVAALLVVFAHSADVVRLSPTVGSSRIAGLAYVDDFGAIGVDLFFVISGFVMALSAGRLTGLTGARDFLALRWARVAPPYLVVTAVLVTWFTTIGDRSLVTWRGVLNAVLFVPVADIASYSTPPLPVGWTLSFEFTFYLAVAVTIVAGLARHLEVLAVALVTFGLAGALTSPEPYLLSWSTNPILIEFALGIAVHALWKRGWLARARPVQLALAAVGAAALALQLVVGYGEVSESDQVLDGGGGLLRVAMWGLPCTLIFLAFVSAGGGRGGRVHRAALRIGDASYSIYLVHLLVFLMVERVLARVPEMPVADVVLVCCVVCAVLVGLGYHRWVERPLTELARRAVARTLHTRPHLQPEPPAVATPGEDRAARLPG
jgi:exopolysaccharide production protein ExoZ